MSVFCACGSSAIYTSGKCAECQGRTSVAWESPVPLSGWIEIRGATAANSHETIATDPDTGGQKGVKPERYSLIPWDAMDEVARVYAAGSEKYSDRNWEQGYKYSQSLDAAFRHLRAAALGEDVDPGSGEWQTKHLASVVFHCLSIMAWQARGTKAKDDRPKVWGQPARPVVSAAAERRADHGEDSTVTTDEPCDSEKSVTGRCSAGIEGCPCIEKSR